MIFELRQYLCKPGQRDVLADMFDREFVESQEAFGSRVLGQFRDLDRDDYFVWMRGFADMGARLRALTGFYQSPTWMAHRVAANATMIDTDDVCLLRGEELTLPPAGGLDAETEPASVVTALVISLPPPVDAGMRASMAVALRPVTSRPGVRDFALLETEHAANDYPALPVRTGENLLVSVLACDGVAPGGADVLGGAEASGGAGVPGVVEPAWFIEALDEAVAQLAALGARTQRLRLRPTRRSRLR